MNKLNKILSRFTGIVSDLEKLQKDNDNHVSSNNTSIAYLSNVNVQLTEEQKRAERICSRLKELTA